MKIHKLNIILFLAVLNMNSLAQVVDTSRSMNTWKLMHDYSRFEDTPMDTSIFDLIIQNDPKYKSGFAYEETGLIGHATQSMYFLDRPLMNQFLFGKAYSPYMASPDNTIFYNTKKPFTEFVYSNIPGTQWGEETVRFLHTQNMDPFSNIGLDFELLAGQELFTNEESRVTKFTLFGSRARDNYSAFGTFHFNRFNNKENGGLSDVESFENNTFPDIWTYPVNLSNAKSSYSNLKLFYTQKFKITEKVTLTDSTGVSRDSGRNFSFNHQLVVERNTRQYEDQTNQQTLTSFYPNFYYYQTSIKDSVIQNQISNTFQFILGDPYTDKLSARIYAGHEFARYGQRSPELYQVFSRWDTISYDPLMLDSVMKDTASTIFSNQFSNELFVGVNLAGPPESKWYWNMSGKYYLAGYYRNNFSLKATFSRQIFDRYRLGLKGTMENRNVSFYHNNYSSAFFKWENDFKASQILLAEAFMADKEENFNATASMAVLTNYLYWNTEALPEQFDKGLYIISGKLFKHFIAGGFNSLNQVMIQYATADEVLHLPLLAFRTDNYWQQSFFKGALIGQFGLNFFITSAYMANAYMPATGVFYLQDNQTVGAFPQVGAFIGLRIKRTRLFGSYNNAYSFLSNNYFSTAGYPSKPGYFRIGLAWTFYD